MKNMQQQYQEVPNVISGKDLDYLSDMFNWMYESYKKTINQIPSVQDEVLKNHLQKCATFFDTNLQNVLTILEGGQNE